MATDFPTDHELLAFFGVEPRVSDRDVPWCYNQLDFEVERGDLVVKCSLSPSYRDIAVLLRRGETELSHLRLGPWKSLRLHTASGTALMIAIFSHESGDQTFGLMLQPKIWVGFGRFQQIPPPATEISSPASDRG